MCETPSLLVARAHNSTDPNLVAQVSPTASRRVAPIPEASVRFPQPFTTIPYEPRSGFGSGSGSRPQLCTTIGNPIVSPLNDDDVASAPLDLDSSSLSHGWTRANLPQAVARDDWPFRDDQNKRSGAGCPLTPGLYGSHSLALTHNGPSSPRSLGRAKPAPSSSSKSHDNDWTAPAFSRRKC